MRQKPKFHLLLTFLFSFVFALTTVAQTEQPLTIGQILQKAEAQRKVYLKEFENLLSVETKTFEIFDKNGQVRKRRVIKSTFIIYQLSKGENLSSEFRNVLEVDGRRTENADRRTEEFFIKILNAESAEKERKKLHDESLRNDLDILVNGFTLFQSVSLEERLVPYFDFTFDGKQIVNGVEVYVIFFRQNRFCPFIAVNYRRERGPVTLSLSYDIDLKDNVDYRERISGKMLIDARTFQVWREERLMTLQPDGFAAPVPLDENIFTFQKSEFGILTPKTIVHTQYELKQKERISIKQGTVMFEYEKFTKPDVEVKAGELKN